MRIYWRCLVTILTASGLITSAYAIHSSTHQQSTPFSPYADMTINTHWDPKYQDLEPMDLWAVSQKTGIKNYRLAFIFDAGNCSPAWGGQTSYPVTKEKSWGSHLTDTLRANGVNYRISFGGEVGTDLSQKCGAHQLILSYEQAITAFKPEGLDFDIENNTADVDKVMRALQEIQNKYPNLKLSFTLPVLPSGLVDQGKTIVSKATTNNLKFTVNLMTMDYGGQQCVNRIDQCAMDAATSVQKFLKTLYPTKTDAELWKMIEITPMIGVNDVAAEQFTLDNTTAVRNFAAKNGINSLSMWSIARDQPCPDKQASPTCSGNNLQTKPYEFSMRFLSTDTPKK